MFSIILPPDMVFLGISIYAHISFLAVSVYMAAYCLSNEQKAKNKTRVVLMHRPQYFIKRLVDERKNAFIPG